MNTLGIISAAIKATAVPENPPEGERATRPWIVTISREAGIDAGAVARRLVELLDEHAEEGARGWRRFDRELVEQVAAEHQVDPEEVRSADERDERLFEHMVHGLSSTRTTSGLAVKIAQTIRHIADKGQAVIVGRGGQSILSKRGNAVHVRLVAPELWRVATFAAATGVTEAAAQRSVRRIDSERTRFVKHHFNHDPADAGLYHVVLNMARVPTEAAARAIMALVR
ncbi:MAG: cytidylate kinase-like family protein [Planctomycetota bacterium]|jgi:cytidylate kinase